jgi:hypothetical protein
MIAEDEKIMYGADAVEWLKRWDNGDSIWSIEMGGLGPGYEQCIQITCAEILRIMIDKCYKADTWEDSEAWGRDREEMREIILKNPIVNKLGLSGAQFGAAQNLAAMFYRQGPIKVMTDDRVKDRHIQVKRNFPEGGI